MPEDGGFEATLKIFFGSDHFLLDRAPLFRYETIVKGQWYAYSNAWVCPCSFTLAAYIFFSISL